MPDEQPVLLHCFAHAGAGISSFHGWSAGLGPDVSPVPHLLPGRDSRRREARVTGRGALLADLMDGFRTVPHTPYVLYGHSLGALVAYTLTRALHEAGLPGPALLAVGPVRRPTPRPNSRTPAGSPTNGCCGCSTRWARCPRAPPPAASGTGP